MDKADLAAYLKDVPFLNVDKRKIVRERTAADVQKAGMLF